MACSPAGRVAVMDVDEVHATSAAKDPTETVGGLAAVPSSLPTITMLVPPVVGPFRANDGATRKPSYVKAAESTCAEPARRRVRSCLGGEGLWVGVTGLRIECLGFMVEGFGFMVERVWV